jgi:hypothetical protein
MLACAYTSTLSSGVQNEKKNVGFIQNGNNVKTGHKNNNNTCVRDMQIEHPVNTGTLGHTVLSSLIG